MRRSGQAHLRLDRLRFPGMLEFGAQPAHLPGRLLGGALGVQRSEALEDGFVALSPGPSPASGRGEQVMQAR